MQNLIMLVIILKIYLFLPINDIYNISFFIDEDRKVSRVRKKVVVNNEDQEHLSVFESHLKQLYENGQLMNSELSYDVFKKGVIGYYNMKGQDLVCERDIITIIDFTMESTKERLWVIDLKNKKLLYNSFVAHGRNTGENNAMNFSNIPESNMSSLGFYYTENTYEGKHGLSLVLNGVDENYNTNAKDRAIVMHGADYVSEEFIGCNGRLGRSLGCPALPMSLHDKVINTIANGTVLFINHDDKPYESEFLRIDTAIEQYMKELMSVDSDQ